MVGRECTLQERRGRYSLVCHQQQVPVKQRSTNVSSSEPLLFSSRALFLFFHLLPPGSPRTRFSIIDSLTRQDILLPDPRARYVVARRNPGVLPIRRHRFTLDKSRSRPPINNSPGITRGFILRNHRDYLLPLRELPKPPGNKIKSVSSCFKMLNADTRLQIMS